MVIKVMLVDDHQLMRDVLVHLLSREQDLDVVAAAADAAESLDLARRARPDVVLMDIDLPGIDGIAATRALLTLHPALKIVMLSASVSKSLIRDAAAAGARGYLLKGDPPDRLTEGIRAAARGDHPMAPQVKALLTSMCQAVERSGDPSAFKAAAWRPES